MKISSPYTSPGQWLKGALHCHSTNSDGGLTPQEVGEIYRKSGYDFISITDHAHRTGPEDVAVPGLLVLPGEELNHPHVLGINIREEIPDEYDFAGEIKAVREQGGLAIVAHPYWMGLLAADVAEQNGYTGIEIYNNVCQCLNGKGLAVTYWDELLQQGKRVWGFATDDAHISENQPECDRAWVMVQAQELTPEAVTDSLQRGDFYSSMGPQIKEITVQGDTISIKTSAVQRVRFIGDRYLGCVVKAPDGGCLEEAEFQVAEGMQYVRIELEDEQRLLAWSNPLFIEPQERICQESASTV